MVRPGPGSGGRLNGARAALGGALRSLRKDKGLTEAELAQRLGLGQTTISRYEGGSRLPPAEILEKIADALGASKRLRRDLFDQLHAASTELQSNRSISRRGMARRQVEIARIEARVARTRSFQTVVVPGLLQTRDYARSIFEASLIETPPEEVARALAARLDRQAVLHDPQKRFEFVVTEAVLLSPRGDLPGMLAQLDRLSVVAQFSNVDLAVLPLGANLPHNPANSFDVLDEDLVLVETLTEQLAIRDPADVALYVKAWEAFRSSAVSGPEAGELLASAADRLQLS